MIAITSIAAHHPNKSIQQQCIKSWINLGFEVYSFNSPSEALIIEKEYPVKVIRTFNTMEQIYGNPLVPISTVLDWIKLQPTDKFMLINSDIELRTDKKTIGRISNKMEEGILLANRIDYNIDSRVDELGKMFEVKNLSGIDVFFIHKKFVNLYAPSMFCFGACFWDYEIPYVALLNRVKVTFIDQFFAFHLRHPMQYNTQKWEKQGRYFQWHHDLFEFKTIPEMSNYIYQYIYKNSNQGTI